MVVDWLQIGNLILGALITFVFSGLGALLAIRLSIRQEIKREEREKKKQVIEILQGGPLPFSSEKAVINSLKIETLSDSEKNIFKILNPHDESDTQQTLPTALLWVYSPPLQGQVFVVQNETIIGRSIGQIQLNDSTVSNPHASISIGSIGQVVLTDLSSDKGTYVNGKKIGSAEIMENDKIIMGEVKF